MVDDDEWREMKRVRVGAKRAVKAGMVGFIASGKPEHLLACALSTMEVKHMMGAGIGRGAVLTGRIVFIEKRQPIFVILQAVTTKTILPDQQRTCS